VNPRALRELFPGRIAVVSSFGAESAVLLHMVAAIDPATPVLFIDTGRHFAETLAYRDRLVAALGLSDLRSVGPTAEKVARLALFPHVGGAKPGVRPAGSAAADRHELMVSQPIVSGSDICSRENRERFQAVSVSAPRWRVRSSPIRRFCCSTSRCPASITPPSRGSSGTCAHGTRRTTSPSCT
jgi:hypothetical protein